MASNKAGRNKRRKLTIRITSIQFTPTSDVDSRLARVYDLLLCSNTVKKAERESDGKPPG